MDKFYYGTSHKWGNFSRNMFHLGGRKFIVLGQDDWVQYWFPIMSFHDDLKKIEDEEGIGIVWS